jgi:hypothetical protein
MRSRIFALAGYRNHAACFGLATVLVLASASALAAKPAPPPPPDPCKSPSVVTGASFPSFIFARNITAKKGPYTTGTFLADATGKCQKKISESWPGAREVNLRYDADTGQVLVVGDGLYAGMTQVSFSPTNGPSVASLGPRVTLLTDSQIVTPAELTSAGWTHFGTSDPRISPDGTQILFKRTYLNRDVTPIWPSWSLDTFWTCDLTYDGNSMIEAVDPSSCTEVHRAPVNDNNNYGSRASWGAKDGTIYITQPSTADALHFSLFRRTLPSAPSPGLVEIFSNGTVLDNVRATATTDPTVSNGELVAVYENDPPPRSCSKVFVIDAYNCAGIGSCEILNNQGQGNGLRSMTWLPDGRIAGRGQLAPNRQGRCYTAGENASLGGTLDAYPAIDPYGTPATVLTTGGGYFEGAEGGW